jgi:hypothetical protein
MENINLVRKIAWEFHYTTGVEYKELFSEAKTLYLEAEKRLDTTCKAKKSVFLWKCMRNGLINFCEREQKMQVMLTKPKTNTNFLNNLGCSYLEMTSMLPIFDNVLDTVNQVQQPEVFFEFYEALPKNCQDLADIVLKNPTRYAMVNPKSARGLVVERLRAKGWAWSKIWDAMRDFKAVLRELPEECYTVTS